MLKDYLPPSEPDPTRVFITEENAYLAFFKEIGYDTLDEFRNAHNTRYTATVFIEGDTATDVYNGLKKHGDLRDFTQDVHVVKASIEE